MNRCAVKVKKEKNRNVKMINQKVSCHLPLVSYFYLKLAISLSTR